MFTNIPLIINLGESGPLTWDMAKQIIQSQHTLAIYGITAVVAVAAGLMVASWLWNLFLRRHELERAIESLKSEITARVEEDFSKLAKKTEEEIEKNVAKKMMELDADKARLFAISARQSAVWGRASMWWAEAIESYAKIGQEHLLRVTVDALNEDLGKCKKLEHKERKAIKKCLSSIPETLNKEKEQIEDKLKKLPKETKEH